MALDSEESLQGLGSSNEVPIVNAKYSRFSEIREERVYVKGNHYEVWRVGILKNIDSGTKFWMYLGRIE